MKAMCVVCVAVALCGRVALVSAKSDGSAVTIEVRDYANVAAMDMAHAVSEVRAIFERSMVPVTVRVEHRSRSGAAPPKTLPATPTVVVHLYSHNADAQIAKEESVLGLVPGAARGGRLAYVFADRVSIVARRNGVEFGQLLGTVLAHEAGHVMLRGRPHAASGVMRPLCDGRQIRNVMLGQVAFAPDELAAIRLNLASRDAS